VIDRREQILSRLEDVLGAVPGIESFARNRGLLDNDARPAIVLLDGDERERTPPVGRSATGRQGMVVNMMTMFPQVFVVLKVAKPQNVDVGPTLNGLRSAVIAAVAADAALRTLVGTNGDIVYTGCETDLKSGSPLDGTGRLDFTLSYPLDPY
jgi:hypothetical protein